jgi:hypothetical protein
MTESSEPLLTASDIVGELEHSIHDQHFSDSAAVMVFLIPFYLQPVPVHSANCL